MASVEPVPIIVAKAKVKGAAQIDVQPVAEVVVKARQPVHVKYLYRLEEASTEKENWRFQLSASIGGVRPAPASADWKDRWGRNDSLWGVLQQEFVFDRPGTYTGSFKVDARYAEGAWGSGASSKQSERTAQGEFRVKVV